MKNWVSHQSSAVSLFMTLLPMIWHLSSLVKSSHAEVSVFQKKKIILKGIRKVFAYDGEGTLIKTVQIQRSAFYSKIRRKQIHLRSVNGFHMQSPAIFSDITTISQPQTAYRDEQEQPPSQVEFGARLCNYSYRSGLKFLSNLVQPHRSTIQWKNHWALREWTELLQSDPRRLQVPSC